MEALPKTIDSLAKSTPPELRHRTDRYDSDDGKEEDEEDDDDLDGLEDDEHNLPTGGQEGEDGKCISPTHEFALTDKTVENVPCSDDDDVGNAESEHFKYSPVRQLHGRSRRRRLRRRRNETAANRGPDSNTPASYGNRRGGRLASICGPSLTAPFLTWLLWLEHCRRASEDRSRSRASARAFVARAGALGPILEACCWILREWQKVGDGHWFDSVGVGLVS